MPRRVLLAALALSTVSTLGACGGGGGGDDAKDAGGFSVSHAIAQLPVPKGDDPVAVSVADVAAVSTADKVTRPRKPADADARWLSEVTGGNDDVVEMLAPPANLTHLDPAGFARATGFSWVQSDWFATISQPPDEFSVYAGPPADATFPASVTESDGIHSVGQGDDYATHVDGDLSADQLGRPLRLAHAHDLLATSMSTPALQDWVGGQGDSLADDPSFAAVARALDDAGDSSAYLQTLHREPVPLVGVGWAAKDGAPVVTIVYDLGSNAAAAAAASDLESAYADGKSAVSQQPYADELPDSTVKADGRVVVVTTHPKAGRVSVPLQMLARNDLPMPGVS